MTPQARMAALMEKARDAGVAADMIRDVGVTKPAAEAIERVAAERFDAGWRADPFTMAQYLTEIEMRTSHTYDAIKPWPSSRLLAQKFKQAVEGRSRFQVWNAPAQTIGKSTWLHWGMLWALDLKPSKKLIYLCYGDRLARDGAVFVRDKARVHHDKLRFELSTSMQTQNEWTTAQGGGLFATTIHGGAAGHPASLGVIIDDPLKNWEEAHSHNARQSVWNEILAVARLRLAEDAFMILCHTRWHRDDPSGRMRQLEEETGERIDYVTLPMHAVDNDLLGRRRGQPLERFSVREAEMRGKTLGPYLRAALEEQDPIEEEGGELKREWWKYTSTPPRSGDQALTSWDMKLKDKATGDYVVGLAGVRVGGSYYFIDRIKGQFSFLQTKCAIALMAVRHPEIRRHVIENTGNGPEVMTELRKGDPDFVMTTAIAGVIGATVDEATAVQDLMRRGMSGLVAENPTTSKIVRARTYSPHLENGDCWLHEGAPWVPNFVDNAAAFPPKAGGHDDDVDAWSQAMKHLSRAPGWVHKPTEPTPTGNPVPDRGGAPREPNRGNARVYR